MDSKDLVSWFAIGDVQGCAGALDRLLARLSTLSTECAAPPRLWYAGDLVNRGEDSAGVLRTIMAQGERAQVVLGNHDLHLLAVARGYAKQKSGDTMDSVLKAPDRDALLAWLQSRPLALFDADAAVLMVHAGVLPQWTAATILKLAREVETVLADPHQADAFFRAMYGNQPSSWEDTLEGIDRLRAIVNALTRLRFCTPAGVMEFESKTEVAPEGYVPWFTLPRASRDTTIVFGHWAAQGLINQTNLIGTDTGCVWGRQLTAVELGVPVVERRVVQVGATA